jgi:hypothetical protein
LGLWPAAYKDVARSLVHHSAASLGLRHPDTLKCAVVLEALKDQGPLRVALRAVLDSFCARRLKSIAWVGTRKRLLQVEQGNSEVQENG